MNIQNARTKIARYINKLTVDATVRTLANAELDSWADELLQEHLEHGEPVEIACVLIENVGTAFQE